MQTTIPGVPPSIEALQDEPRKTCARCGHDMPISRMRPTLISSLWRCTPDCRDELRDMEQKFEAAMDRLYELQVVSGMEDTLDDITEELCAAFARVLSMARENEVPETAQA